MNGFAWGFLAPKGPTDSWALQFGTAEEELGSIWKPLNMILKRVKESDGRAQRLFFARS